MTRQCRDGSGRVNDWTRPGYTRPGVVGEQRERKNDAPCCCFCSDEEEREVQTAILHSVVEAHGGYGGNINNKQPWQLLAAPSLPCTPLPNAPTPESMAPAARKCAARPASTFCYRRTISLPPSSFSTSSRKMALWNRLRNYNSSSPIPICFRPMSLRKCRPYKVRDAIHCFLNKVIFSLYLLVCLDRLFFVLSILVGLSLICKCASD